MAYDPSGAHSVAILRDQTTKAQHRVRAVEAALIYGLEPVCAAVAAIWWINETMAPRAIAGGALIVLGVMLAQWDPRPRARIESAE